MLDVLNVYNFVYIVLNLNLREHDHFLIERARFKMLVDLEQISNGVSARTQCKFEPHKFKINVI